MSSLFCGCCIRLFRGRGDTPSLNRLTAESVDVLSHASLQDDRGAPDSTPDPPSPTPNSAHLVSENESIPPVEPGNANQENQGAYDVVAPAIQDDRSEAAPMSDTRDGSSPMNVQPRDPGPVSSSSVSPYPTQEARVPTEIVSDPHTPSGVDELIELREKCGHFRVLVLGRANAGKTTLLKAVCGASGDPEIFYNNAWERMMAERNRDSDQASQSLLSPTSGRGEHNINTQLVFPSNRGFIFHDSRGFEAGSDEELKAVREFIQRKGSSRELKDQLHVIWYCIPTDNVARLLSGPEQELLRMCSAGSVPLVVIFTKFDSLEAKAFHELKGAGLTRQQAQQDAPQHAYAEFQRCHLPHLFGEKHPKYICLKKMHKEQNKTEIERKMAELMQQTVDAMDVDALKLLLVSVQQNNLQLTIEYAVKHGGMGKVAQVVFAGGNVVTAQHVENLIKELLGWFKYIVYKADDLETDPYRLANKVLGEFHSEIYPHLASLVGSLPSHLHIPTLAIGILIVAAQLFWHAHGKRPAASQIKEVMELYLTSGRANAVRTQVEEEFGTLTQHYTQWKADGVIKIVMENLLRDH